MKKTLTNNIAPGKGQPFGKRSLEHLQSGFIEAIAAIVEAVNRGRKQVVYLTGCTVTSSASQHTNAAGWAFHNGEVYRVEEGLVNSPGTPVWVVEQTFENGGAVPFSNLEFHEILAVRRLKLAAPGTPGGIELANAEAFPSLLSSMHSHSISQVTGLQELVNALTEAMDNKADKGHSEWIPLTLINGAIDTGISTSNGFQAAYMVDGFGCVHFRGDVIIPRNGQVSFARLPIELTPPGNKIMQGVCSGSNVGKEVVRVGILPSETWMDNRAVQMDMFAVLDYSAGNYQSVKLEAFKYFIN